MQRSATRTGKVEFPDWFVSGELARLVVGDGVGDGACAAEFACMAV